MEKLGILQDIRQQLLGGTTTSELMARYAAGSVYKAQRQLRKQTTIVMSKPGQSSEETKEGGCDGKAFMRLHNEIMRLTENVSDLTGRLRDSEAEIDEAEIQAEAWKNAYESSKAKNDCRI